MVHVRVVFIDFMQLTSVFLVGFSPNILIKSGGSSRPFFCTELTRLRAKGFRMSCRTFALFELKSNPLWWGFSFVQIAIFCQAAFDWKWRATGIRGKRMIMSTGQKKNEKESSFDIGKTANWLFTVD